MKQLQQAGSQPWLIRYRNWFLIVGILMFLPPLSFIFQLTADSNFCGTWCPRMFFVWRKGMTFQAYSSGFIRSYMGAILVCLILAVTFFTGRHWCSHLCPIGGTMEIVSRMIPERFKIDFSAIPAPSFRYGYMAVYFGAAAFGIGSLCCSYCNFATIPRLFGMFFSPADLAYFLRTAGLVNLGLIVILGFLAKGGRAYCNLLCPVGALDALSNTAGMTLGKRVVLNPGRCDSCGICKKNCPTWAISVETRARIDPLSCIPCRTCERSCPRQAIRFRKPPLQTIQPAGDMRHENF